MNICRGQSILEYILLIGVVTLALYYMGPAFKRGIQSVAKVTVDQLGNQQSADQDFTEDGGHLEISKSQSNSSSNKQVRERLYTTTTHVNESMDMVTNSSTNGGFAAN